MKALWKKLAVALIVGAGVCVAAVLGLVVFLRIDAAHERSRVIQLTEIEQLQEAFNEDEGSIRMIVLLSPT